MTIERRYALARPFLLSLNSYARLTGVHPDLVRRLTTLGCSRSLGMLKVTSGSRRRRFPRWQEFNDCTGN